MEPAGIELERLKIGMAGDADARNTIAIAAGLLPELFRGEGVFVTRRVHLRHDLRIEV